MELRKINEQLKYLIELNTNLDFNFNVKNNMIVYNFTYVDKQGYKQIIIKDFNFDKEVINPTDIIEHLKEINPFYVK